MQNMVNEIKEHLISDIIPFWKNLKDETYGGFYGYMDYDLKVDQKAVKGCILNSRITWFFANAYTLLGETELLTYARHGYEFLKNYCMDKEKGGVFWSVTYDGKPEDTTKHTYNQAFSIYALSSYYEASGDEEALILAKQLMEIIEERCTNENGYMEAFDREFKPVENDKLSENGVIAEKTMNTLLHVFEAYTELYRVSKDARVKERLEWMMDLMAERIYNPALHRQEVFFDNDYHSLIDLHSYGHDIETAWLIDRGVEVLEEESYKKKMTPITRTLTERIYEVAFDGHSLANECENGVVNQHRIWWVQAETVVGFLNGYQKDRSHREYLEAAKSQWQFIKDHVIDKRKGSEWFWEVNPDGTPILGRPIVEPWKCPYHNGRMCFEVLKRAKIL